MTYLALDIETDTNAIQVDPDIPAGLDPRAAQIIAFTVMRDDGLLIHQQSTHLGGERMLLENIYGTLASMDPTDVLLTWNGGAFDLPYIASRMIVHDMPELPLAHSGRAPKYSALPTWPGVMAVDFDGQGDHLDLAYMCQHYCAEVESKWSLKPFYQALWADSNRPVQIPPPLADPDVNRAEFAGDMRPPALAEYNIHDCEMLIHIIHFVNALPDSTRDGFDLWSSIWVDSSVL